MIAKTINCWLGKPNCFKQEIITLHVALSKVLSRDINLNLSINQGDWISEIDFIFEALDSDKSGGYVQLQTSGTTGEPKKIVKYLPYELENKKGKGSSDDVWLLTYNPVRWAGLSVLLHAINYNSTIVVPNDLSIDSLYQALIDNSITHLSLTPSLFRKLLLKDVDKLSSIPIKQLTFGGEYTTQKVLNEARQLWSQAKITHVYASTELGDICAVSDGIEGIPISKLNYKIINNELWVNDKSTGDSWIEKDNRLFFLGRTQEIINVGGAKVNPIEIEKIIENMIGVSCCMVYAIPNALLGQVVGLKYVGDLSPADLKAKLKLALPKYANPLKIEQVTEIVLSSAGKIKR